MTDLDDLLGDSSSPSTAPAAPRQMPDAAHFHKPVSVSFLAEVFGMDPKTARSRLAKCEVAEWVKGRGPSAGRQVPTYDFVKAADYLTDPKLDLERYLFSLSSSSNSHKIPANLLKGFWDAMNARAKWEENARRLWRDEDVLAVLGEVAIQIRDVSLLWVEELPGRATLSTENYQALRAAVGDLLEQIKDKLIEMPKKRRTTSLVREMEEMLGGADVKAAVADLGDETAD